jgi:hypothetical protein
MFGCISRRAFVSGTAVGAMATLADLKFLRGLPPVSADEAQLPADAVRFTPEMEPLVRLLEDTPRERLLEEVAAKIRAGTTYPQILGALLLAGVRNVQPRPSVGHKFHTVLVVNSAHLASLGSPDEHRWLPIFWALDYFKSAQDQDTREGNWTMRTLDDNRLPDSAQAQSAFETAMNSWDEEPADLAIAALARSAKPKDIYELFFRFGARDFRSIGHKAIYVANSYRTLEYIGHENAEPVLRSLAYALQMRGSDPPDVIAAADKPWHDNQERVKQISDNWQKGTLDDAATRELLATLRSGTADEACENVVAVLNQGVSPQSVWDALFVGASELLVRQAGIVALHAVTSTNALHAAYKVTENDETRRLLLLQNAAFLPLFLEAMHGRGRVAEFKLDDLRPAELSATGDDALPEIFAAISSDRHAAAGKVLTYAETNPNPQALIDGARLLMFIKGSNAHDYKFSSAVWEDFKNVSPAWRNRYLAASVFQLRGSGDRDNPLVERTRAALT